ncbi:hypothetical protein LCGC14_2081410 [marine sediment metagenome]|uniref:Uncharacterized protein n=1 Tax=marine sediment metagenome TaxID=412755 RepID=A0A0F9F2X3_9ZZZZ
MKKTGFTVDASSILRQVEREFNAGNNAVPGIVMGCQMIRASLHKIAARSLELNDPALLAEMHRLCCIRPAKGG